MPILKLLWALTILGGLSVTLVLRFAGMLARIPGKLTAIRSRLSQYWQGIYQLDARVAVVLVFGVLGLGPLFLTFAVGPLADWQSYSIVVAVVTGLVQAIVMIEQANISLRQSNISRTQAEITQAQALMAEESNRIAADTLRTNREIERAYIVLEHVDVQIEQDTHQPEQPLQVVVHFQIRNIGRTPGDLLGGWFGYCLRDKPSSPDLSRGLSNLTPVFLGAGAFVDFSAPTRADESIATMQAIVRGNHTELRLWFVGELDYRDRFGQLHTSGYGRKFDPDKRSLQFSPETAAFNFDGPIVPHRRTHYHSALPDGKDS